MFYEDLYTGTMIGTPVSNEVELLDKVLALASEVIALLAQSGSEEDPILRLTMEEDYQAAELHVPGLKVDYSQLDLDTDRINAYECEGVTYFDVIVFSVDVDISY